VTARSNGGEVRRRGKKASDQMMTDDEIRLAYQAHGVDSAGECVTEAQLVRAATGAADESERLRIADHLIACARCAEEYRVLTSLKPWTEESAAVLNPEVRRATAARTLSRGLQYAIAASLILTFGVGLWIGAVWRRSQQASTQDAARVEAERDHQLADARRQAEDLRRRTEDQQREIAELRRDRESVAAPEPNVPIVELEPADTFRSAPQGRRTIELPSSAKLVTLVVSAVQSLPSRMYVIEMTDPHGRVIWTSSGLRPSADGSFTVAVPRVLLPSGEAHLRLYSQRGSRRDLVEDYAVRFAYQ